MFVYPLYCGHRPVTDRLKLKVTCLVGQNDLSILHRPLIGRPMKLDLFNILVKNQNDLLNCWSL